MMRKLIFIVIVCTLNISVHAQTECKSETKEKEIFQKWLKVVDKNAPINDIVLQTALHFVGTPYVAATLEVGQKEQLVVNLDKFDCMTFAENCIALSRTAKYCKEHFFKYYQQELEKLRYRNGVLDGYTSRLHYTSDWIYDNTSNMGLVYDKTKDIGGKPIDFNVYYMSTNPQYYPRLKNNFEEVKKMKGYEEKVNARNNTYYHIPKESIQAASKHIKSGDIICFVTSAKGLDIAHLGIAYWKNGVLTFIHASQSQKKVVVNSESMVDYCRTTKNNNGIIVLEVK